MTKQVIEAAFELVEKPVARCSDSTLGRRRGLDPAASRAAREAGTALKRMRLMRIVMLRKDRRLSECAIHTSLASFMMYPTPAPLASEAMTQSIGSELSFDRGVQGLRKAALSMSKSSSETAAGASQFSIG